MAFMKKSLILLLVVSAIIAAFYGMQALGKRTGKAYVLANELKAQGLAFDRMNVARSTNMYEEISISGQDLLVKISHYGNGLFLKQIKHNLRHDKEETNSKEPIYVGGAYIIVVYLEPSKGYVRSFLEKYFPGLEEY